MTTLEPQGSTNDINYSQAGQQKPRNASVLNINRQKRQAEVDATLLANRIMMLDNE